MDGAQSGGQPQGSTLLAERSAKMPGPPARTLQLEKTRMAAPVRFSRWFGKSNLKVRRVHVPGDLRDLRHLSTVVNPDLGLDRGLELGAHGGNQVLVLFPIRGEVDRLLRVRLKVEQFRVVRLVEFFKRHRAVAIDWGEVPRELVAAVEHRTQAAALLEVGLVTGFLQFVFGGLVRGDG